MHAPRSIALGLAVAGLALGGHIASAAIAPRPVPVGSAAALAGDRVVTVLGQPPGPARVVIRGEDGPPATLATLSPPGRKRAGYYVQSLAASATTWAVALEAIEVPNADENPQHERGELIGSRPPAADP